MSLPSTWAGKVSEKDQAWCNEMCKAARAHCYDKCMASTGLKMVYTPAMAPVGTPVRIQVGSLDAAAIHSHPPVTFTVVEDVMVDGQLLIKKGTTGFAHYVSGWLAQNGYGVTQCSSTAGVAMNTQLEMSRRASPSVPIIPGIGMANVIQNIPLSFANPRAPGSSEEALVPLKDCRAHNVNLTAYISGPPGPPMLAPPPAR
jgi:hypothetical protein